MTPVVERVREAAAARSTLRISAAGTWMNAGRPVAAAETLSLAEHAGIVEYVPGDLTLTARAGTRLADIAAVTREHGQWLPLEPWGGDDGSIGATIATATAGPHAHSLGLPRDVVLGMEFVTGGGSVVRSGGRVVKNVAGFDLTRLVTGSWGTLGVIMEVTVRLRALPQETRTLALPTSVAAPELSALALRLRALPFTPLASELLGGALASQLGLGAAPVLLVRAGGNARSVAAQLDRLREFGSPADVSESIWGALRTTVGVRETASWRWSRLPSVFGDTWTAAEAATREIRGTFMHGNPARGVVRVIVPHGNSKPESLARAASVFSGTVAVEQLPAQAWPLLPATPGDELSSRVRGAFDPAGILNPGIMDAIA